MRVIKGLYRKIIDENAADWFESIEIIQNQIATLELH